MIISGNIFGDACGKGLFCALIIRKTLKIFKPEKVYEGSFQKVRSKESSSNIITYHWCNYSYYTSFMQTSGRLRSLSGKREKHPFTQKA